MSRRGIISRMFGGVKSYTYKISGMRMLKPCAYFITDTISGVTRSMGRREAPRDFDEVIKESGLSQQELEKKKRGLLLQCVLYLTLGIVAFFYASMQVAKLGFFVVVNYYLVALVLFGFAFRMHFYRFLLIRKNLQLSCRDWMRAVLSGDI